MSELYLGVDGGNSKTVAAVVSADGVFWGRGRAGNADIYGASSIEEAVTSVVTAARAALAEAQASPEELRGVAFRLAGIDFPEDAHFWEETLQREFPGFVRVSVGNDGFSTLRLGRLDGVGVAVNVGTGPALAARAPGGQEAFSGWWVFDDLGGMGIGNQAIEAVARSHMGIGPATSLTEGLLTLYGEETVEAMHHSFCRRWGRRPREDRSRAARTVLELARSGDAVAASIIDGQITRYLTYLGWVCAEVGQRPSPEFPVLLSGGVATSENGIFRDSFTRAIQETYPEAAIVVPSGSPLVGVLLDAMAEARGNVTAQQRQRLEEAAQPAGFLTT